MSKYLTRAYLASIIRGTPYLRRLALKRKISVDYPSFLLIEPTNHCNLKCVFCPRGSSPRKLGFMGMETLGKIVTDSLKHGRREVIGFQKDGEPLLHKRLEEMVRYVKKKNAAKILHMATNAILLDEDRAHSIIESGLDDVLISLDASSSDTYKKVKGINAFEKVERNVRNFLAIRKKMGYDKPFVRVKIINMQGTDQEVGEFKKRWKNSADWVEVRQFVPWGDVDDKSALDYSTVKRYPCPYLWYMAAVNWDGSVSVCCGDYMCKGVVGDIQSESLHDIWHSPLLQSYRRAHLEGRFEDVAVCKDCKVWLQEEDIGYWLEKKFAE